MKKPAVHLLSCLLVLVLFFSVMTTKGLAQDAGNGPLAHGVALYKAQDYTGSIDAFKKAEAENPAHHEAFLWHILAVMAGGNDLAQVNEAAIVWNNRTVLDANAQAMAHYLLALGYWRADYVSTAQMYFGLASTHKNAPAYPLAQAALKSMMNKEPIPPIEKWASLAGLTGKAIPGPQSPAPKIQNTIPAINEDGTVLADRPIPKCPLAQKGVKNGTPPDPNVLEKVFRCQGGEKAAAVGMDGAFIINVQSMQIGKRRLMDYLIDKGDGVPGKTFVYPVKVTWTEKTFYRTRTAVVERKIAIVNFNINSLGQWQYGSATNISEGTYRSIPRGQ